MIYLVAGGLLLVFFAWTGRKSRQREALSGLRRHFPATARTAFMVRLPSVHESIPDEEFSRLFESIYAEHLRRFGASNFGDLMGRTIDLGGEAERLSQRICRDAVDELPAYFRALLGNDPVLLEEAGAAFYAALQNAGAETQAELDSNR